MVSVKWKTGVSYLLSAALCLSIAIPSFAAPQPGTSSQRHFKPPTLKEESKVRNAQALIKDQKYKKNELLVKFKATEPQANIDKLLSNNQIASTRKSRSGIINLTFKPGTDLQKELSNLLSNSGVEFAQPNFQYKAAYVPNDPNYSKQWSLSKINAPMAWDITRGDSNLIVAVIDTGADLNHEDLSGKLVPGYDFVHNTNVPMDDNGHGTMTAGIIGAATGNGLGIAGLASNVKIMPLKVLNSSGTGFDADIVDAIYYAVDNGAKVINMSLGSSGYSYADADAIGYARNKGVVVVAASGNDSGNVRSYPAAFPSVISVGATDQVDNKASFSNYGYTLDLTAPGVNIISTYLSTSTIGKYAAGDGTSFAAPHVTALAALLKSKYPLATVGQIEQYMKDSAVDLGSPGRDQYYGWGRIDAYKALTTTLQSGDTYEPNDTPDTAKAVATGNFAATLYPSQDLDAYKVNLNPGDNIRVSVTPPSELDPYIQLYDANQNLLTTTDAKDIGVAENLSYTLASSAPAGTYYVVVGDYYDAASAKPYQLSISINPPTIVSLTPTAAIFAPYMSNTFIAGYADIHGYQDMQKAYFRVESTPAGGPTVIAYYDQPTNKLWLSNDTLTGWLATPLTPGTKGSVSNSYAVLNALGTSVSGSGNNLSIKWYISFKTSMSGKSYNTSLRAIDSAGNDSGYISVGTLAARTALR